MGREPQFVQALQIQPKFRAGAEEMRQTQGGVARDGTSSVQDLGDPIGRNVEPAGQPGCAHVGRFEFFGQVFAGRIAMQAIENPSSVIVND